MLGKVIKAVFGGGNSSKGEAKDEEASHLDYQGFTIIAIPRARGSQWQIAGRITRDIDGVVKEYEFLRADTMTSRDEAAEFSIRKGKIIIDEQGLTLFD